MKNWIKNNKGVIVFYIITMILTCLLVLRLESLNY